jgi:hypothetical protein
MNLGVVESESVDALTNKKASIAMVPLAMKTTCCVFLAMVVGASAVDGNIRRWLQSCTTPPTLSTVHIVPVVSGLSLKAYTNGTVVQSYPSSSTFDNWKFENAGGGLYRLINDGTKGALSGTYS